MVDVWQPDHDPFEVQEIIKEIPQWFKHSGRLQSTHEDDQLLVAISELKFLKEYLTPFTVKETRQLIKILFPTKSKTIYGMRNSYGFNNLFEKVSMSIMGAYHKKNCDNDTVKEAFELEGFIWEQDGPNRFMNITENEAKRANRLFFK